MVGAVMNFYEGAKTRVRVGLELSEEFEEKVVKSLFWLRLSNLAYIEQNGQDQSNLIFCHLTNLIRS